jgi:hypothetical protein
VFSTPEPELPPTVSTWWRNQFAPTFDESFSTGPACTTFGTLLGCPMIVASEPAGASDAAVWGATRVSSAPAGRSDSLREAALP